MKGDLQGKRARFFSKHTHTVSRSHSVSFCSNTYRDCFWGYSGRVVKFTTHLRLVQRFRMSGATPVRPLYDFMASTGTTLPQGRNKQSVSAWHRPPGCSKGKTSAFFLLDSSYNVMARGDARKGKWRGNWRMEWTASTLHTTSEHGVSNITTADALTSAASSRLNWRPPADLKGLVRFAERRNLVSARVPSHFNWPILPASVGRDGSVSIATRKGLEGPGIEHLWGEQIFGTLPDRLGVPPSLFHNGHRISSTGLERPGRVEFHPSSAKLKERLELIFYSPLVQ